MAIDDEATGHHGVHGREGFLPPLLLGVGYGDLHPQVVLGHPQVLPVEEGKTLDSAEGTARVLLVGLDVGRPFALGEIAHAKPVEIRTRLRLLLIHYRLPVRAARVLREGSREACTLGRRTWSHRPPTLSRWAPHSARYCGVGTASFLRGAMARSSPACCAAIGSNRFNVQIEPLRLM